MSLDGNANHCYTTYEINISLLCQQLNVQYWSCLCVCMSVNITDGMNKIVYSIVTGNFTCNTTKASK